MKLIKTLVVLLVLQVLGIGSYFLYVESNDRRNLELTTTRQDLAISLYKHCEENVELCPKNKEELQTFNPEAYDILNKQNTLEYMNDEGHWVLMVSYKGQKFVHDSESEYVTAGEIFPI